MTPKRSRPKAGARQAIKRRTYETGFRLLAPDRILFVIVLDRRRLALVLDTLEAYDNA